MTAGVFLESLQVVETHRLLVEYAHEKFEGVVVLEPRHVVRGCAKGEGMGLREHVMPVEFFEDAPGYLPRYSIRRRPFHEVLTVALDQGHIVPSVEDQPKLVGFLSAESCHVHGDAVDLVLEQDNAQGPLQGTLLQRVIVVPGYALSAALDELAHAVIDADARADGPHLVRHVGEIDGLDSGDGLHLGRRLDLEDAYGVGTVERLVDLPVLKVDARQIDIVAGALLDKLQGSLHLGQRAKGQEVDLHKTRVDDAVLVPVADVATLHSAGLHRHLLGERRRAQDHAAGVLRQILGKAVELPRQVDQVAPHRRVGPVAELRQRLHLLVQIARMMGIDSLRQLAQVLGG